MKGNYPEASFDRKTHTYMLDGRVLPSITQIIKTAWPIAPSFVGADPAVVDNARERGVEVDEIFCRWVNNEFDEEIPAGYRQDSADLAGRLIDWWVTKDYRDERVQCVLNNDEIAGTVDIVAYTKAGVPAILDLKTTYSLDPYYDIQVGGYCYLYWHSLGVMPSQAGLIHLTARLPEPRLVLIDPGKAIADFMTVLDMYRLIQRKGAKNDK